MKGVKNIKKNSEEYGNVEKLLNNLYPGIRKF